MEVEPKYSFIYLPEENDLQFLDKNIQELFQKWGLNIKIQRFCFNETFHEYHKFHLAETFFKDENVAKVLKIWDDSCFTEKCFIRATEIDIKQVPCTIKKLSFFDKLKNPDNNIIYNSGRIFQCHYNEIDDIIIADNLRTMLIDKNSDKYKLFSDVERSEFIFKLLKLLCLGGKYCQYEDEIDIYLNTTKNLYKNLIKVKKTENDELKIETIVLEVISKYNNEAYFPKNPNHIQNIGFLLINPSDRQLITLLHQFN